jgi:ATP-binding cassette, subfamily B, bacterial
VSSGRSPLAPLVRDGLAHLGRVRRAARLTRLTALYGFTACPLWMTATTVMLLAASTTGVIYPFGYRSIVDGVLRRDVGLTVAGVAMSAGIFGLSWAFSIIGATQSSALTDRVNILLSTRIGYLLASIPSIEHFERPEYQAEVALLNQNRRALAASPRLALGLFLTFVQTVLIAVILAGIYPLLGLLPLMAVAPLLADDAAVRIQERATQRMAERARLSDEIYLMLTTAATATELRVYGVQNELRDRYRLLVEEIRKANVAASLRGLAWSAVGWLCYALAFGGTMAVLVVLAVDGHVSIGEVVMAIALIRRVQSQAGSMSDSFGQMITNVRTALRLMWLESLATRASDRAPDGTGTARLPGHLAEGIVLDRVGFTYPGTGQAVLRDISLTLPAGATVAVVGENGAGKSTLVKLLLRLYEPTSGQIMVDGERLAGTDLAEWRARCSAAFQDFVRFELRAGHVVGVGDLARKDDDDAVLEALESAQGLDVISSLNQGLDTPVGHTFPAGRELSGGQWQKFALARASMPRAPLLMVLDEPTANLDAHAEAALFARLANAARRAGASRAVTVLVSHRFPSARIADLIVVLDQGTVAEIGDHDSLLARNGRYAEMYRLQARSFQESVPGVS